ncbi:MAG: ATP synthase F1 subunit delta, partial [Chloroflexota bacterium]
ALLTAVATTYGELVDQRAGIVKAKITTPVELEEAQRSAFVQRLERSSGKKLRATFTVDPSLVGGAKVQLGDHLIDGSIRAQLERLRTQLVAGR